ncbi:TPA: hypothetical protein ACXZT8_003801 [Salmonella enterica]|nr:hypothetical protein [Salmonella enterica]
MNIRLNCLVLSLLLLSRQVLCGEHLLFIHALSVSSNPSGININVTDGGTGSSFMPGFSNGVVSLRERWCSAEQERRNMQLDQVSWVVAKQNQNIAGIPVTVSLSGSGWSNPSYHPDVPGYVKLQFYTHKTGLGYCNDYNKPIYTYSRDISFANMNINISPDVKYAVPGVYSGYVEVYLGEVEHYYDDKNDAGNAIVMSKLTDIATKIVNYGSSVKIPVILTIDSKCQVNSYGTINLSHGTLPMNKANGHISNKVALSLNCSKETTVKISALGTKNVDGLTNSTVCGSGRCDIVINGGGGSYKQTSKVHNISVESQFFTTRPEPGSFDGSGILRIEFD